MILVMISKLEGVAKNTLPLLMKIKLKPEEAEPYDPVVEVLKDKEVLQLLEEVDSHNKFKVLQDDTFGSLLAVKFLPMFQQNLHCLIVSIDKDVNETDKLEEQVLSNLTIIKALLEAVYAS